MDNCDPTVFNRFLFCEDISALRAKYDRLDALLDKLITLSEKQLQFIKEVEDDMKKYAKELRNG